MHRINNEIYFCQTYYVDQGAFVFTAHLKAFLLKLGFSFNYYMNKI